MKGTLRKVYRYKKKYSNLLGKPDIEFVNYAVNMGSGKFSLEKQYIRILKGLEKI